jgi:cobalt/nickel transport system permease protein
MTYPDLTPESPLHAFDPRVKVVTALLLIVGILLTPDGAYPAYPLLWALIASLGVLGRVSPLHLARRSAFAAPFALAGVTLLFTTPGTPLATIGGLALTDAGVIRFGGVLLKMLLAAQVSLLLTLTTPFVDLLWALQALRVPAPLVQITALLYRYLFTLKEDGARLLAARSARSASTPGRTAGGRLIWRAQVAGSMVGSLFVRSVERGERVYAAMAARGFDGALRPTMTAPLRWRSAVIGALPLIALISIQVAARLW